jgi:hypothetical protein
MYAKIVFRKVAAWRGKPPNCFFTFDDFFSLLSFSSSVLWFQKQNHEKCFGSQM